MAAAHPEPVEGYTVNLHFELPEDIALRFKNRTDSEIRELVLAAIREKLEAEDGTPLRLSSPARETELRTFISEMAAKVEAGGGIERTVHSEMYADRGP